jgi:hypothetical protein
MEITAVGGNWFSLYNGGSSFEYNTGPNPTAQRHDDRRPSAEIFRHIDGDMVLARIMGGPAKKFFYKDSSYDAALELARCYVTDYFNDLAVQVDIFS